MNMIFIRSLVFYIVLIPFTIFYATLCLFTFPLPFQYRYIAVTTWSRFMVWWLGACCNLHYKVEGSENIPKGAAIILSKHQSMWETIAFQKIFPTQTWVMKRSLLFIPFFGWALALIEPISIIRHQKKKSVHQIIEQGRKQLKAGKLVIIFPEGQRVLPGEHGHFATGGARLAEKTGYPVIPVAHNAGEFWKRRGFLKHPGTIHVIIGAPIESKDKSFEQINDEAKHWIKKTMKRLSPVHEAHERIETPLLAVDIIIELEQYSPPSIVFIERRKSPHGWAFPGGFVDPGETLMHAACREALEETGLVIEPKTLLSLYSNPKRDARGHVISAVYIATANQTPKAGDDAKQVKVVSMSELSDELINTLVFDHALIMQDYLTYKKTGQHPPLSR